MSPAMAATLPTALGESSGSATLPAEGSRSETREMLYSKPPIPVSAHMSGMIGKQTDSKLGGGGIAEDAPRRPAGPKQPRLGLTRK